MYEVRFAEKGYPDGWNKVSDAFTPKEAAERFVERYEWDSLEFPCASGIPVAVEVREEKVWTDRDEWVKTFTVTGEQVAVYSAKE